VRYWFTVDIEGQGLREGPEGKEEERDDERKVVSISHSFLHRGATVKTMWW